MTVLLFTILCFQDPTLRLSGRIVDQKSGEDLRGTVNLLRLSENVPDVDITVLSRRNGWYEAGIPVAGTYRVVAVVQGFRPCIKTIQAKATSSTIHLNFEMRKGSTLSLTLKDQEGLSVEGAWATLFYEGDNPQNDLEWTYLQIYTGCDTARSRKGTLFWEGLPEGPWEIRINRPGYIPVTITTDRSRVEVTMRKGRLIYLTIENEDGSRAPDIFVSIHSGGGPIFSGVTGAFGDVAVTMLPGVNDLFLYRLPRGRERIHREVKLGEQQRLTIRWGLP